MTRSVFNHRRGGGGYVGQVLQDSPLVYWRLGEPSGATAADSSGNGRTGTYTASGFNGTITYGAASAILSDPTDKAVTLGVRPVVTATIANVVSAATTAFDTASMTVEIWVHPTSGQSANHTAASSATYVSGNPNNVRWILKIDPGGVIWIFDGSINHVSSVTVALNAWSHLVVTFTGGNYRIYVNGSLGQTIAGVLGAGTNNPMTAGGSGGGIFVGSIDEYAFYGTALSAGRIGAHYAASH